jgi:hypothetical protein
MFAETKENSATIPVAYRPVHLSMVGSLKSGDFEPLHGEPLPSIKLTPSGSRMIPAH